MPVTGPQLRKERRAADVTVIAIAARMGLSRQAIHNLERAAEPDPERVVAFRAAVASERDAKVASRGRVA